jgi:hypothetical protein
MVDFEKMSDEELLSEELELSELLEKLIEKDEYGSYYYDCANLDLFCVRDEKQKRGLNVKS